MDLSKNGPVLRLLDANANRAREALRVLEDYARFVLSSDELSLSLKEIRHEFANVLRARLADAILHRDTPADVGTEHKTQSEFQRQNLAEVVTASGKRLGEALRAIEEYLKTIAPDDARRIEQLRYRFYRIEQRLDRTFGGKSRFENIRLCVLITEEHCRGHWLHAAEQVLLGGADCLQLREKDLNDRELLHRARQLVQLCRQHERLCIINDRPDLAILSDADGVHLGQEDFPATEVRKLIGREKLLGVSTHSIEQAKRAQFDGADYIGIGPIFPSTTKPQESVAGVELARQVASQVRLPAVAISGITEANVDEVLKTGIRAIAVTGAALDCDDPQAATAALKRRLLAVQSHCQAPENTVRSS